MHKKYEINRIKIKGGYQSGTKVVTHNSKSDLPLNQYFTCKIGKKKYLPSAPDWGSLVFVGFKLSTEKDSTP